MRDARTDGLVQENDALETAYDLDDALVALAVTATLKRVSPTPELRARLMRTVAKRRRHAA